MSTGVYARKPWQEKFLARIIVDESGCWLWVGCVKSNGYGWVNTGQKSMYAHRVSYELFIGPIPSGLQLDHLCRVRHCVNPEHLEPVTARTNNLRGESQAAVRARSTTCIYGHELYGANLWMRSGRWRVCRACKAKRDKIYKDRVRGKGQVAGQQVQEAQEIYQHRLT